MSDYNTNEKMAIFNSRKLDTGKTWILFLLFGWSHGSMGKVGTQILFYLTAGGLGIWALRRLFKLNSKMREHNKNIAIEIGLEHKDMLVLGLLK